MQSQASCSLLLVTSVLPQQQLPAATLEMHNSWALPGTVLPGNRFSSCLARIVLLSSHDLLVRARSDLPLSVLLSPGQAAVD